MRAPLLVTPPGRGRIRQRLVSLVGTSLAAFVLSPLAMAKEPDGPSEPAKPLPRDTVGGHVSVSARAGLSLPFGSLAAGAAATDYLSSGLLVGGDVAYGVSRSVMLGVYGQWAQHDGSGLWNGDSASILAGGALVRYHLAQGVRFDPWMSYGVGFRSLSIGDSSLTGVDWARLQLGGDWYAASALGFGPVLELSLGTLFGSDELGGARAVNATFVVGGRVVLDIPGK